MLSTHSPQPDQTQTAFSQGLAADIATQILDFWRHQYLLMEIKGRGLLAEAGGGGSGA